MSAVAVAAFCAGACSVTHHYKEESRLTSPAGSNVAIVYSDSGSDSSKWCYSKVAVLAKGAGVDLAAIEDQRQFVFAVPCRAAVALNWRSADELEIGYTLADDGFQVFQERASSDGRVHLVYSPKS